MKRVLSSLCIAISTYSKLPCPQADYSEENRRFSLCFFPLVGIVIGALEWAWFALCARLPFGAFLRGAIACLIPLLVSGGIHLDGLMDTMDALGSHRDPEACLRILKDSHVGAFAVMGLGVYLLLDAAMLSEIAPGEALWSLAFLFPLSRALSASNLLTMRSARTGGMADGFIQASDRKTVLLILLAESALCAGAMLMLGKLAGLFALLPGIVFLLWFRRMARMRFGGVTGDLAGFFLTGFELCAACGIALSQAVLP